MMMIEWWLYLSWSMKKPSIKGVLSSDWISLAPTMALPVFGFEQLMWPHALNPDVCISTYVTQSKE